MCTAGDLAAIGRHGISPFARVRVSDSEEKSESKQLLVAKNILTLVRFFMEPLQFLELIIVLRFIFSFCSCTAGYAAVGQRIERGNQSLLVQLLW